MCLIINKPLNSRNRRLTGSRTYYKVLAYSSDKDCLVAPYQGTVIDSKGGMVKSSRRRRPITKQEDRWHRVYEGIHVKTNRKSAETLAGAVAYRMVVPVKVQFRNLVSFGKKRDAVFTQVRYDAQSLHDALQKARKEHQKRHYY